MKLWNNPRQCKTQSLTLSQRLHCGGNSQRSCDTPSLPSPSWAPCLFWGRRSSESWGPAPLSGSTSAPRHFPPGWTVVTAASSLQGISIHRNIKNTVSSECLSQKVQWTQAHNISSGTKIHTHRHVCLRGTSVTSALQPPPSILEINRKWHDLPED